MVLVAYLGTWTHACWAALTDPSWQADDARTALFPFHRYSDNAPLANDPIANEMLEYQPYAVRAIYRALVPFFGLLAASKLVQAAMLSIILGGAAVLAFSRRAGLGAAALFAFLFLHDWYVIGRSAGGLPRGFGFPCMILWLAGALTHRPRVRQGSAALAALTYPPGLAMILGAEGFYALRNFGRPGWRTALRRVKRYAALVAACGALLAPSVFWGASNGGPIHTLEEAREDPAFGRAGRLLVLPFKDTGSAFGRAFIDAFEPTGPSIAPRIADWAREHSDQASSFFVVLLLLLPIMRMSPPPIAVLGFFAACLCLHALAILLAFRMYSPVRFYAYGMHVVAPGLAASTLGFVAPRLKPSRRQPLRNFVAAGAIIALWAGLGNGVSPKHAFNLSLNYRADAPLWEFIRSLPQDSRLASHLRDGDSIPLFGLRATNGTFETMQPWLTRSWERQKTRAKDTLRALYATEPRELFDYCKKYRVSHLFLDQHRYRRDFVRRSQSFEPFTSFAQELLDKRRLKDLVLADLPEEAIVFEYRHYTIVDVERLKQAWARPADESKNNKQRRKKKRRR